MLGGSLYIFSTFFLASAKRGLRRRFIPQKMEQITPPPFNPSLYHSCLSPTSILLETSQCVLKNGISNQMNRFPRPYGPGRKKGCQFQGVQRGQFRNSPTPLEVYYNPEGRTRNRDAHSASTADTLGSGMAPLRSPPSYPQKDTPGVDWHLRQAVRVHVSSALSFTMT